MRIRWQIGVCRELSLGRTEEPRLGSNAKAIVGIRRCGKTFRLYQEIVDLIESGVERVRICYFNFDDDRVRPDDGPLVSRVIEAFFALHPRARSAGAYVF